MQLYFSPLACSLATRIALYEAGIAATYHQVDRATRRASDGTRIDEVHPLGLVPVLRLDDGSLLTENAAILQHVADGTPLAPREGRAQLQQWLSFIGTELHKMVFIPQLDHHAPDGAKRYGLAKADARLAVVAHHLADRAYLLDAFSVADAYLFTILNWTQAVPAVDLARWPALVAYLKRLRQRPALARAVAEEVELFALEHAKLARPRTTRQVIDRFNDVFQRHDPAALDDLVDDACVIDNTDGGHHAGKAACIALWRGIATDPAIAFDLEEVTVDDDHATIAWRLRAADRAVRGVNLMRVRDGRIVEARGYTRPAS